MKKTAIAITFLLFYSLTQAQSLKLKTMTLQEISDRIAIKELVDTFSILADKKETDKQRYLFTENATSRTFIGETPFRSLAGANNWVMPSEHF